MEVEEFIRTVCLTHCLQQMECLYGEKIELPEAAGSTAKPDNKLKIEPRKVEFKGQKTGTTSKDLLNGPLVLDQQCIMDLFAIKREFGNISNNRIITIALKLGLNQLSVALGLLKDKMKE